MILTVCISYGYSEELHNGFSLALEAHFIGHSLPVISIFCDCGKQLILTLFGKLALRF
jgi:hypothetical protein